MKIKNPFLNEVAEQKAKTAEMRLDIAMALYHRVDLLALRSIGRAVGILDENYRLRPYKQGTVITISTHEHLRDMVNHDCVSFDKILEIAGLTKDDIRIANKHVVLIDEAIRIMAGGENNDEDKSPESC